MGSRSIRFTFGVTLQAKSGVGFSCRVTSIGRLEALEGPTGRRRNVLLPRPAPLAFFRDKPNHWDPALTRVVLVSSDTLF